MKLKKIIIIVLTLSIQITSIPIDVMAQEVTQEAPEVSPVATETNPSSAPSEMPTPTPLQDSAGQAAFDQSTSTPIPTQEQKAVEPLVTPPSEFENPTPAQSAIKGLATFGEPGQSARLRARSIIRKLRKAVYRADEKITIVIENAKASEITAKLFTLDGVEVANAFQEISDEDPVVLRTNSMRPFMPGRYRLKVTDADGNTSTQDFTWGVLAINTNKSIYKPEEPAKLAMAVLDDGGNMVCDADVTLRISGPKNADLSTENSLITVNPECQEKAFTLKPDYEATFEVGGVGVYTMDLTATTSRGTYTITDSFEVRSEVPFDVERHTATRIYPAAVYPVEMTITANEDFEGVVTETVPGEFVIKKHDSLVSFDKIESKAVRSIQSDVLEAGVFNIGLPFKGDYAMTLGFGKQHKDQTLTKKYTDFGVLGHDGVDFDLPVGTEVISVDKGTVVRAREDSDYGTTVVVQHVWGRSYYGHLSKMLVKEGDSVKKGDVIALSGNTGLSSGPHLHFGMKAERNDPDNGYRGKINPSPFLGFKEPALQQVAGVSTSSVAEVTTAGFKVLTWQVSLKKGETIKLGYTYDAPDVSPFYYRLGPLEFRKNNTLVFNEARRWQIASDSVVVVSGLVEAEEMQFGGYQRKIVYVNSNWYAFYGDTGTLVYKKSADGVTWGSVVGIAAGGDVDNYNITVSVSNNFIHMFWTDVSANEIEGKRMDTATDTQGTLCTGMASQGTLASTFMPTVTSISDTAVVLAYSDTSSDTEAEEFEITTLDGTCAVTAVSPGNVVFNSEMGSGDRPVMWSKGSGTDVAGMLFQDGNLSYASYSATLDEWRWNNQTIAADTNTMYSIAGNGSSVWALSASATSTNLYKCCTVDLVESQLDSDAGSNGQDNLSDVDIYCVSATDCKAVWTDDIDTTAPKLVFRDCSDATCSTGTTTTIDSDVGASGDYSNPSLYCVASDNCKVVYGDALDTAAPIHAFLDCDSATQCDTTPTPFSIMADFGAATDIPRTSIDCIGGDTDCKVLVNDAAASDLSFVDCSAANCNSTTLNDIDGTAGIEPKSDMYCISATNCKVIYHDVTGGDVIFVNCGTAGTPATCATLSGDSTTLDANVGTTNGSNDVAVDCVGGDTDCKVLFSDSTDGDLTFVDCSSNICAVGTSRDIDTTGANNGTNAPSISMDCPAVDNCKFTYVGDTTSSSEKVYFGECDDATCSIGSMYELPGVRFKAAIDCPTSADCKMVYYKGTTGTAPTVEFADCDTEDCLPTWDSLTAPFTSETGITEVSLTYDSSNSDLIASIIKDTTDKAYYKVSDATSISWGSAVDYDFASGYLSGLTTPITAAGTSQMGALIRQGSNIEFDLYASSPTTMVTQRSYRWRADDGAESAGTAILAANTSNSGLDIDEDIRLRFQIQNAGNASATNYNYRLEYAARDITDNICNGTNESYAQVPDSPTTEPFDMVTTTNYADGDASTNTVAGAGVLTDPATGTFVAGKLVESTSNSTGNLTLTDNQFTELEYAFQPNSNATEGGFYCFRLTNAGAALDQYPVYPELRVGPDKIVTSDNGTNDNRHLRSGTNVVFVSDLVGYVFYVDNSSNPDINYVKTTDGGETWGSPVEVANVSGDALKVDVWYDRWTPGDTTGTNIHLVYVNNLDDDLYYNRLNTSDDSLLGGTAASTDEANTIDGTEPINIVKGTDGDLYITMKDPNGGAGSGLNYVLKCTGTCNSSANWVAAGTTPYVAASEGGESIMMPLSGGDILLIDFDPTNDDMQSKVYDDGTDTWDAGFATIDLNAPDSTVYDSAFGASVNKSTGAIYLAYAADNATLGGSDDIRTAVYSGGSWTAKTDVIANSGAAGGDAACAGVTNCGVTIAKVAIDENTDDVYVVYGAQVTPGNSNNSVLYWRYSTDDMTTWSTESDGISTPGILQAVSLNLMSDERIYATWFDDTSNLLMGNTVIDLTIPEVTDPTNDQLLRHGVWFDGGVEQPFTY